ncbi:MAG: sensor histidine kinase [Chitinophagaceae bacterium]|nr:sensor histidine kinase [Chitinophagaceae bacterium]
MNCIENGIRYNEQVPAVIDIRLSAVDGFNKITISDNGMGIPKEHWPQLFEKFYRVPKGNLHPVKGYGLGLFYVKKIIEMHGGRISLIASLARAAISFYFYHKNLNNTN